MSFHQRTIKVGPTLHVLMQRVLTSWEWLLFLFNLSLPFVYRLQFVNSTSWPYLIAIIIRLIATSIASCMDFHHYKYTPSEKVDFKDSNLGNYHFILYLFDSLINRLNFIVIASPSHFWWNHINIVDSIDYWLSSVLPK